MDESWPTHGIASSPYSLQKAYVERVLDAFEVAHPQIRVVRFRSALVLKREAGPQALRLSWPAPLKVTARRRRRCTTAGRAEALSGDA